MTLKYLKKLSYCFVIGLCCIFSVIAGCGKNDIEPSDLATALDDASHPVTIEALLEKNIFPENSSMALTYPVAFIPVDRFLACYSMIPLATGNEIPTTLVGILYQPEQNQMEDGTHTESTDSIPVDIDGFHKVSNRNDLQYLIRVSENGGYTLWEFTNFAFCNVCQKNGQFLCAPIKDSYTYMDVLSLVYGLESYTDVDEIIISPIVSHRRESDGHGQTSETIRITSQDSIAEFYRILSPIRPYLGDWTDIEESQLAKSLGIQRGNPDTVAFERVITLRLKNGAIIENLSYSAITSMFFAVGIAEFCPISEEDATIINNMMGIQGHRNEKQESNSKP